ncbi:RNF31, partial [Cervus elaphus hippelaphus]
MPGEEEKRAFLEAREELASALRRDSGQAFTQEQLWPLLGTSLPPEARYLQLDAARLVRCNAHGEPRNYLNTLSTALNILEKYGRNLLSPQRPRYWRGVKFNNPVFRSTVDAVQGGRDVLRLYGYTEEQPDGLSFPERQEEPDEQQVATVTLEVLLLRTELNLLLQNAHPKPQALEQLLKDKVEDDLLQLSEFAPLLREIAPGPLTIPSAAGSTPGPCFLCGSAPGTLHCSTCKQALCLTCDRLFHGHPDRAHHHRQTLHGAPQALHHGLSQPPARLLWPCSACALLNEPWAVLCVACDRPRGCKGLGLVIEGPQGTGGLESELSRGHWACQSCTFENEAAAVLCAICERPRLAQPPSLVVDSLDSGICPKPLQGDPVLSSVQTPVWYCIHCTFCNSGPGWVCAMCNRTSSPIPVQQTPQPHASSSEERQAEPGPSRRLSAPVTSSCGDLEQQRQDKMREEGLQLVIKIREGEAGGACPEEVFSALQYSGTEVPLQWLRSELPYVLEMVAELAEQQDPGLGAFSCQEARKAWLDRHGNLDEAVEECVRTRRRKVQELRSLGFGPEEGSLQALFQHGGDVARALTELQRQRLEPFHQRLWDSGPEPTPSWDGPDKQSLVRRLLAVHALPSWGRAELALALLQETPRNYELGDVVEAVRQSQDRAFLRRLLAQECAVCGWALPRNRNVSPQDWDGRGSRVGAPVRSEGRRLWRNSPGEEETSGGPSNVSISPTPRPLMQGFLRGQDPNSFQLPLSHLGFHQKCPDPNCRVKKSLHGHHPRDCLFYLRDWSAGRLQKLLQDNNVMFNTEPPAGARAVPGGGCRVMEQKEVPNGFRDEACGKETPAGYAGLCQAHYKEYLVSLINAHSLDPATLYETEELMTAAERYLHMRPQALPGEDIPTYHARLRGALGTEYPPQEEVAEGEGPKEGPVMQALTSCECTICPDCFRQHFTIALKEKHITDMVCPACGRPDLTDDTQLLSYFSTLDIQLRESLEPDAYALFHKKLTEGVLMRDPKFLWCAQWEEQHRGRSCEDFQNWKRTNDPEYQAQGLAMYLQENGIDCPKCKFSYALARGGCMHFHCTQCRHQFCSGCYNAFYAKNVSPQDWDGRGSRVGAPVRSEGRRLWRNSPGEEETSG